MLKRIFYKMPVFINLLKHPVLAFTFWAEFKKFSELNDGRFALRAWQLYPCLNDKTVGTVFDAHYLYHPAWAARILAQTKPDKHVDISSTLNFCTMLSAFVPTEFYDYRPAGISLSNLKSDQADLTDLPFADNSLKSLSCMHTIEHVGLGRYGDKINPQGDLQAVSELKRVTAPGGDLLLVVPVSGEARLQFNAHRIYRYDQIINLFDNFELINFSLVDDNKNFINKASEFEADKQRWGCACFWFRKKI